jgi:hypothetical protein
MVRKVYSLVAKLMVDLYASLLGREMRYYFFACPLPDYIYVFITVYCHSDHILVYIYSNKS